MSLITWLYLIDVVGGLQCVFVMLSIMTGVMLFISGLFWFLSSNSYEEKQRIDAAKVIKPLAYVFPFVLFGAILVPSQKTLYLMLGAKTTQDIIANPKVQETGGKVLDLINQKLEEFGESNKGKSK